MVAAHLSGMTTITEDLPATLNATDRCERCGAQAYTLFVHPEFGRLLFCAHHHRVHAAALLDQGFRLVLDLRHLLAPQKAQPA